MIYLSVEDILEIHQIQIKTYGGKSGILDKGLLEHLSVAPKQTFDGNDLYVSIFEKAAKYFVGFSQSQVFEDGNKRVASGCLYVFLDLNGYKLSVTKYEVSKLCLDVSNNQKGIKDVVKFLETHTQKIK